MPVIFGLPHFATFRKVSVHRSLIPYVTIAIYILLGSIMFYQIELKLKQTHDLRAYNDAKCIKSYYSALFFVFSAVSTIGFGVVYPCTDVGRGLSVVYICAGLPQLFLILSDVGARICNWLTIVYRYVAVWLKARKTRQTIDNQEKRQSVGVKAPWADFDMTVEPDPEIVEAQEKEKEARHLAELEDTPVWLGIALTGFCFFLSFVYFLWAESQVAWEAIYSAVLTYLAGDYTVKNFQAAAMCYALVIIGFSVLSGTIQMVQKNARNLMVRMKTQVDARLADMQIRIERGEIDATAAKEMLKDALKDQMSGGGIFKSIVSAFISNRDMADMTAHCEATAVESALTTELEKLKSVTYAEVGVQAKMPKKPLEDSACDTCYLEPEVDENHAQTDENIVEVISENSFMNFMRGDKYSVSGANSGAVLFPRAKSFFLMADMASQLEKAAQEGTLDEKLAHSSTMGVIHDRRRKSGIELADQATSKVKFGLGEPNGEAIQK